MHIRHPILKLFLFLHLWIFVPCRLSPPKHVLPRSLTLLDPWLPRLHAKTCIYSITLALRSPGTSCFEPICPSKSRHFMFEPI